MVSVTSSVAWGIVSRGHGKVLLGTPEFQSLGPSNGSGVLSMPVLGLAAMSAGPGRLNI